MRTRKGLAFLLMLAGLLAGCISTTFGAIVPDPRMGGELKVTVSANPEDFKEATYTIEGDTTLVVRGRDIKRYFDVNESRPEYVVIEYRNGVLAWVHLHQRISKKPPKP